MHWWIVNTNRSKEKDEPKFDDARNNVIEDEYKVWWLVISVEFLNKEMKRCFPMTTHLHSEKLINCFSINLFLSEGMVFLGKYIMQNWYSLFTFRPFGKNLLWITPWKWKEIFIMSLIFQKHWHSLLVSTSFRSDLK